MFIYFLFIYSLFSDKKVLKIFGPRTWCTKKPFSYRSGTPLRYILTSSSGLTEHILIYSNYEKIDNQGKRRKKKYQAKT